MIIIVPRTCWTEMTWRYIGGQERELLSSSLSASSVGLVSADCSTLPSYDIADPIEVFAKVRYFVLACLVGFRSPSIFKSM